MAKRTKLELSTYEAQALQIAVRASLRAHGFEMTDETPRTMRADKPWYAETSHIDSLVRLYARLNRILTGHKQYNAVIPYTRRPNT